MHEWLSTIVLGVIGAFVLALFAEDLIKHHNAKRAADKTAAARKRLDDAR